MNYSIMSYEPVLYIEETDHQGKRDTRVFVSYCGGDTYRVRMTRRDKKHKRIPDFEFDFLSRNALATFLVYAVSVEYGSFANITMFMLNYDDLTGREFDDYYRVYKDTRKRQELFGYDNCGPSSFNYDAVMELALTLRDMRS